ARVTVLETVVKPAQPVDDGGDRASVAPSSPGAMRQRVEAEENALRARLDVAERTPGEVVDEALGAAVSKADALAEEDVPRAHLNAPAEGGDRETLVSAGAAPPPPSSAPRPIPLERQMGLEADAEKLDRVDRLAAVLGLSRDEMLARCFESGLPIKEAEARV